MGCHQGLGQPRRERLRGAETDSNPGHGRRRHRYRYGLLLIILVTTYLLSAFLNADWFKIVQMAMFIGVAMLALRTAPFQRRTTRIVVTVTLAGSIAMALYLALGRHDADRGAASAWVALILLLTVVLIVRNVLRFPVVTSRSIYGAISAYLLIGMMFAAIYGAVYYLHHQQFFTNQASPPTMPVFQYFSFTTLTTLGYGDYTAATNGGRAIAMIEAITGQIFLATLVARLVSAFRPESARSKASDDQGGRTDG